MELTDQESGIIIYNDISVGVFNWGNIHDYSIPVTFCGRPISWPLSDDFAFDKVKNTVRKIDDIRTEIPGSIWLNDESGIAETNLDIVFDENCDLLRLFLGDEEYDPSREHTAGWIYDLPDGCKIIAPIGWA